MKAAAATGWLAGMAMAAAGWPLLAAIGACALPVAGVVVWRRWGKRAAASAAAAAQGRWMRLRARKETGSAPERA